MSLHRAVYARDADAAASLLSAGADADTVGSLDSMTPLGIAVRALDLRMIEVLLQAGANPNLRDDNDCTAVSYLFTYGTDIYLLAPAFDEGLIPRVLDLLQDAGCDLNATVCDDGSTLLCHALTSPFGKGWYSHQTFTGLVVDELVCRDVDVNATNDDGVTALMAAMGADLNDVEDIAKTLLDAGADPTATDDSGATVLHHAVRRAYPAAAKLALVELLFDYGDPDVNAVDNTGRSALEMAVATGYPALVNILLRSP
jgi:ankyrin repeat protein